MIILFLKPKLAVLVLALAFLPVASMAAGEMGRYSVNLATNDTLGTYLVNQTGFSLYYFMKDAPGNGTSNCIGKCSEIWPPFYAETLTVAEGLKATDFTIINRTDGIKQIAFKGWPLYLYSMDTKPNVANGQGFNKLWSVVNPTASTFKQPIPANFMQPAGQAQSSTGGYSGGY